MSLAAAFCLTATAQEEDVTHLIKNAGFDTGLTFTDEGKPVNETTATGKTTSRSRFIVSTDGSYYAVPTDGKSTNVNGDLGWYGFLGNIDGWEIPDDKNDKGEYLYITTEPEWKYFGAIPYSVKEGYLALADGDKRFFVPPTKPEGHDTDDNTGFLYLRAGWGGACVYKQTVNLPCAKYRLEYWTINTNTDATAAAVNLSKVTCRKDVFTDDGGLNSTEWTKHEIEFTPVDEFSIEFGFKSEGISSKNPFLCIDGIKLYKTGEASEEEIYSGDLYALQGEFYELSSNYGEYAGLSAEAEELAFSIDEIVDGGDVAEMKAAIESLTAAKELIIKAVETVPSLIALYDKATAALANNYPGAAALQAVTDKFDGVVNEGTAAEILAYYDELKAAYNTYMMSQEATEANPADYTFLVKNPLFVKEGNEPTIDGNVFTYPNQDTFEAGKAPEIATSETWYKSGTCTDGDQRLNYAQGRVCWNAWRANADGKTLAVSSDIANLPNGYYKVAGDLITESAYVNDQHVFATSALQSANSASLTEGLWNSNNDGQWTTLTSDKVLVHDGKLTIGASGTLANKNQSGWFCATNFKLYYLGAASEEEVQAALAAKAEYANTLVAAMHFGADKANATDSIAEYTKTGDLAFLNAAIKLAEASEAKYEAINAEGQTIPTVAQNIADNTYAEAAEIVKAGYDATLAYINNGTYNKVDSIITILKGYAETYAPVYNSAAEALAAMTSETAKKALSETMANQKAVLVANLMSTDYINAAVLELKAAIAVAQAQDNYENNPDATDYTGFIMNAKSESTDGWTVIKGDGDGPVKKGQYFTDDANRNYFDTWNATAGKNNLYIEQVIEGLPNGTYTLGANVRTSGLGACIFGAVGTEAADTTWMEIPMQTYTHQDNATGEWVTDDATDKYGQIWEDAVKALQTDKENAYLASISNANAGKGRGWMHLDIPNIEVTNHTLTIGLTSDSTKTNKHTTVTWYSATDFTLTLTAKGNNDGWNGPVTGITEIENEALKSDAIYNINGQRVANLGKQGLYIVVRNGKATKVMTK